MAARRREEIVAEARALALLEHHEALARELARLQRLQWQLALPELRRALGEDVEPGPLPRLPGDEILPVVDAAQALAARIERLRAELGALELLLAAMRPEERELLEREPRTVPERRLRRLVIRRLVVLIGGAPVSDGAAEARGPAGAEAAHGRRASTSR